MNKNAIISTVIGFIIGTTTALMNAPVAKAEAPAPQPLRIDSQAASAPGLDVYQASKRTIRVTFLDGGTASDISGMTPFMSWATNSTASAVSTASVSVVDSTNGVVDFTFAASAVNFTPGRYIYEVGVKSNATTIYRQGVFTIRGSPYAAGASAIEWTQNVDWDIVDSVGTLTVDAINLGGTTWSNWMTNVSSLTNDAGYLTSFTETDPIWAAVSNTVTSGAALGKTAVQPGDTIGNATNAQYAAVAGSATNWVGSSFFGLQAVTDIGNTTTNNILIADLDIMGANRTNRISTIGDAMYYATGAGGHQFYGGPLMGNGSGLTDLPASAITNLGSAALLSSNAFATASQGSKADTALQAGASITNLTGYGTAAYSNSTAFAEAVHAHSYATNSAFADLAASASNLVATASPSIAGLTVSTGTVSAATLRVTGTAFASAATITNRLTVAGIDNSGATTNTASTVWRSGSETKAAVDATTGAVTVRGEDSDERYGWVDCRLVNAGRVGSYLSGIWHNSTPYCLSHNDITQWEVPPHAKYLKVIFEIGAHGTNDVYAFRNTAIQCVQLNDSTNTYANLLQINEDSVTFNAKTSAIRTNITYTLSSPATNYPTRFQWGIRSPAVGKTMITNNVYVFGVKAYIGD